MKFDQLLGPSYTLFSPKAEVQRAVNTYRQRVETDQGLGPYALFKSPGLSPLFQPNGGAGQFRGNGLVLNPGGPANVDNAVVVIDATAYRLTGPTTIAQTYATALANDGKPVRFAASGFSVLMISAGILYRADATTITTPATGLGVTFVDVVFLDTYYVGVTNTNQFYFSSDDGVTWDPADVQTAEASPEGLLGAIVHYETLFLMGNRTTQAYVVGPDPNAPFVPQSSGVIPFGIEAGPTLQSLGQYRYWLGRNRDGTGVVFRSHGYAVEPISNLALDNKIREYERDFGIQDAFACPYKMNGQEFYRLIFPSADASWELNATVTQHTGVPEWSEVAWWDFCGDTGFRRHRANLILSAFGKILAGDRQNGWLYELSPDNYTDFGYPLKFLRRAPHIVEDGHRVQYDRLALAMELGVGLDPPLWLHSYDRDRTTFVSDLASMAPLTGQVEVELVDLGLNSDTSAVTFRRTQFRFVKSDYPAGSTFSISGVVSNADATSKTVQILDDSASVIASFVIPNGTALQTRIDNLCTWNPSANDGVYMIKLPATTNVGDIVIDVIRIDVTVAPAGPGSTMAITIPMSASEGNTALDQTSGGGDISRTTSTSFSALGGNTTWHFKYNASEWETISTIRFAAVFTSAVTGSGRGGEICLWDIDAAADLSGVSLTNFTDPDTYPVYKDVDFSPSVLTDGHTYEVRIRRVGVTVANCYFHKARLEFHLSPWSKALIPFRPAKGVTATVSRLKLAASSAFNAGTITSRFVESMGATDPGQLNQGSYLADAGVTDVAGTFTSVTAAFAGPYTSTLPTGAPFRSGDISSSLVEGDRYGLNRTAFINNQTQMLLWFQISSSAVAPITAAQAVVLQQIYDCVPYTPLDPYPGPDTMALLGFYEWGRDPTIQLEYSNDGGITFHDPLSRKLGKSGEHRTRIVWDRLGIARDRVFQLWCTDPVRIALSTAWLDAQAWIS